VAGWLAAGTASAATLCGATQHNKLSDYLAPGFSCRLGDLIFSGFSYHYGSPLGADTGPVADSHYAAGRGSIGSGTNVAASNVDVLVAVGGMGLTFGGNWVVDRYQTVDLLLQYTVTPFGKLLSQARNSYNLSVTGTPCAGCPAAIKTPIAKATYGAGQSAFFTNSMYVFPTPTIGPTTILNTVHMDANNVCCGTTTTRTKDTQVVHLSAFTDTFAVINFATPEPASWLLMGAGLGLLAVVRKRRAAAG
jgi:hypothetical protein